MILFGSGFKPRRPFRWSSSTSSSLDLIKLDKFPPDHLSKRWDTTISRAASISADIDTVIYENEDENPYESLVVDNYSDSYERRMKAMSLMVLMLL